LALTVLALVLQRQGLNAYGAGGNGLGYSGACSRQTPFTTSITPKHRLRIGYLGAIKAPLWLILAQQHIAIHQNGVITSALGWTNTSASVSGGGDQ
jgi:hypothetical protein